MKARLICLVLTMLSVSSCAYRERSADAAIDWETVRELLTAAEEKTGYVASSSTGSNLSDDPNTTIYFFDAGAGLSAMRSIFAFKDLAFLNLPYSMSDVEVARVFFMDNSTSNPRNVLIVGIGLYGSDTMEYYSFEGNGSVQDGEFTANLVGSGGNVIVSSYDTDVGELKSSIQLRVSNTDNIPYGKFSILAGFR